MSTPFKMKGSPMQRNFGIGSPLHDHEKDKDGNVIKHETAKQKYQKAKKEGKVKPRTLTHKIKRFFRNLGN